jgi:ABC-type transport system substrate-binding protein
MRQVTRISRLLLCAASVAVAAAIPHAGMPPVAGAAGTTLSAAFTDNFTSMDPAIGYDPFSWSGEHAVFNALLGYAAKPGKAGTKLVPDLAAGLPKVTARGRVYTVSLRPNVRFAPPVNRVVTAADVQYSLERMLAKATAGPMYQSPFYAPLAGSKAFWAGKAKHISGIRVLNARTVQFRLSSPDLAFENILALPFSSVVPKEVVARWGKNFAHHVVGTGPYTMQSWTHTQMILVKNPNYFRPGLPKVPRVSIQFGVDEHLQVLRAEKNQLDLPGNIVSGTDYLAILRSSFKKDMVPLTDIGVQYLAMNTQMAPFKGNVHLRRAFNDAIDKGHILRLLNGRGVQVNGVLPPTMPGANAHFKLYPYSQKQARVELAKAGYKPGRLKLTMLYIGGSDLDRVADSIQQDLGAIGVQISLKPVSENNAYNLVYTPGKSALTLFHWGQDYPDPSDFIDPILTCGASSNAAFYCNHAVDSMAARARGITNAPARYALYRTVNRTIMNDAPWVPLYTDVLYEFHAPEVKGFFYHPIWPFMYEQYSL